MLRLYRVGTLRLVVTYIYGEFPDTRYSGRRSRNISYVGSPDRDLPPTIEQFT